MRYSDKGSPMTIEHLGEAIYIMVCRRAQVQRLLLKDEMRKPTLWFARRFKRRHDDRLKLSRPVRQEVKRFYCVNARSMCNHFPTIEKIVEDEWLTAYRMFNLDEVGATPEMDFDGHTQKKHLLRRHRTVDVKLIEWAWHYRITIIPDVSASGKYGPSLFIFNN